VRILTRDANDPMWANFTDAVQTPKTKTRKTVLQR